MIISRGYGVLGRVVHHIQRPSHTQVLQCTRASHAWSYRIGAPQPSRATKFFTEVVGGFMWWWVLWHLWHESDHITGEFAYPNPRKWTDEELGIPPDDEVEVEAPPDEEPVAPADDSE